MTRLLCFLLFVMIADSRDRKQQWCFLYRWNLISSFKLAVTNQGGISKQLCQCLQENKKLQKGLFRWATIFTAPLKSTLRFAYQRKVEQRLSGIQKIILLPPKCLFLFSAKGEF